MYILMLPISPLAALKLEYYHYNPELLVLRFFFCLSLTTPLMVLVFHNLTAGSERSELGEGLLAGACYTNEQCVATINANYTVHPGQMFQSIVKQNEIHS